MEIKDYKAPKAMVVEVTGQTVVCTSFDNGINSMSIDEDGGNDFE